MWAVLPAKDLVDAKQRLAAALSPAERRLLFRTRMKLLTALPQATAYRRVTRDQAAVSCLAADRRPGPGQTAAISARRRLRRGAAA
jgi:2-phospho-L-lactate guanylyltransferase (CobY/MobA/RfbA family)